MSLLEWQAGANVMRCREDGVMWRPSIRHVSLLVQPCAFCMCMSNLHADAVVGKVTPLLQAARAAISWHSRCLIMVK